MDMRIKLSAFAIIYFALSQAGFAQETPERPNSVDHAGIIQALGDEEFEAGKSIYMNLCTNCHGSDRITPPLPTARAFGRSLGGQVEA